MSQNVLSLFSGAGGAVEGFKQSDYNVVAAVDFNEDCIATLKENHPTTMAIQEDLSETPPSEFSDKYNIPVESIDVVVGGPPCQGFSIVGKRELGDDRNECIIDFLDYVSYYNPDSVLMENVTGIMSMADGEIVEHIYETLERFGYNTVVETHNAANYGVPQLRERVLFVGKKNGYFSITASEPQQTVEDALEKVEEHHPNHKLTNHGEKARNMIAETEWGEPIYDSFDLILRLNPNDPAPTLLAEGWQFGHPYEPRSLTIHERALLQSFPQDYVFKGNKVPQQHQTGNAVPPKMIKKVAEYLEIE